MIWTKLASLFMAVGIALGAFGAHALRAKLTGSQMDIYKTASFYHLIHALGLFVVAWVSAQTQDPKILWAGVMMILGIVLFSGSLYALSITGLKWLGAITPLGGICFIISWLIIFTVAI